jgi:hypothetical protein
VRLECRIVDDIQVLRYPETPGVGKHGSARNDPQRLFEAEGKICFRDEQVKVCCMLCRDLKLLESRSSGIVDRIVSLATVTELFPEVVVFMMAIPPH